MGRAQAIREKMNKCTECKTNWGNDRCGGLCNACFKNGAPNAAEKKAAARRAGEQSLMTAWAVAKLDDNFKLGGSGAVAIVNGKEFHVCTHAGGEDNDGYIGYDGFYIDFGKDNEVDSFIDRMRPKFPSPCDNC